MDKFKNNGLNQCEYRLPDKSPETCRVAVGHRLDQTRRGRRSIAALTMYNAQGTGHKAYTP